MSKALLFKKKKPLEKRIEEAERIRVKYPDRIPCIVEQAAGSDLPPLENTKFLVPENLTMGQFVHVVRKRIKLSPEKAIFIFINHALPLQSSKLKEVYEKDKDEDGFLYIEYSGENTFGQRPI
jgi:GABA(A) receptor-associated protein